ncbi:hypothetical protein [Paludibacterium sp.]|uniref:hypothetical protein n=1 Tax=Paludibacterium sp. TaxID=1917523 RepID=UPI0025FBB046|nr:hypothetical protein [Paludibacterium sp.]
MKQVTCSQVRVVSEEDLKHIYGGGIEPGSTADKVKNGFMAGYSGSRGCYARAQDVMQGRNMGRGGRRKN